MGIVRIGIHTVACMDTIPSGLDPERTLTYMSSYSYLSVVYVCLVGLFTKMILMKNKFFV